MPGRIVGAWLGVSALWGASFLFIRIAAPALGPFPLMAARVVLAAAVLFAFARMRRESVPLRAHAGPLLVLGLVHAAAPYALIAGAEVHMTASASAVLLAVQPLWTAVLGAALGERSSLRTWAGLLLGVLGVGMLVGWQPQAPDRQALAGACAVLIAAALYAAGSLYARRKLSNVPPLTLALGQQITAAFWLAVPAALAWPREWPGVRVLVAVAALALLCTSLAYLLFFWLIARLGAVRTSTVGYAIPVFGVLWGTLWLGERPTPGLLAGLGTILAGLLMAQTRPARTPDASIPQRHGEAREAG